MDRKQHAFIAALHIKYAEAMVQYAARATGDEHLAEDLVQETFLTAMGKIDKVFAHPNPAGWLFRTLQHITAREMDLAYHSAELPMTDESFLKDREDAFASLEDMLPKNLSGEDRELLALRFEKEWGYDAIADYKGITQSACRQRMSRAVRRCRKEMEKECGDLSQNSLLSGC